MSFLETPRFPDNISRGAVGGTVFQTDVAILDSGYEYRNQAQAFGLARYDVSHAARIKTDYDTLLTFFMAVHGRLHGFRFKDWLDFSATSSQGVFAMLTSTTFQMYKRYTSGALSYDRIIQKPYGTITVTGGSGASVASTTGICTVSSGTPTAWSGEFDVPCRFDTDIHAGDLIGRSGSQLVGGWSGIQVSEIRL